MLKFKLSVICRECEASEQETVSYILAQTPRAHSQKDRQRKRDLLRIP